MRPPLRRVSVITCALLVLASCSDSTDGESESVVTTSTTRAPTDATTTTATSAESTSSTPATSAITAPETTAPDTTGSETTVPGSTSATPTSSGEADGEALLALQPFLDQVGAIMADAAEVWPIVDAARDAGAETFPEEGWALSDEIGAAFYGLAALLPHGLDADVRTAAVRLIYDVGNHVAPFIFAPGFDFPSWDPAWDTSRAAGEASVPVDRDALLAVAGEKGDLADLAPTGAAVAEDAVLDVVVVRSFGHNLATSPLPYAVRWLGELPPPSAESEIPFCANVPFEGATFTGSFVDGAGGCIIVYYGSADADAYEADLQAFLADPAGVGTPPGEIVTVVWDDASGAFVAYGSWE